MIDELSEMTALQAIRGRPEMYVKGEEAASVADQLLQASLCHPLAELSCGTASRVRVTLDILAATISDDGQGWPVHEVAGGQRFAERMLCTLNSCRDHKQHAELAKALCRISLPAVVALSEVFTLDIYREGEHWQQIYRDGEPDATLTLVGATEKSGTTLTFVLNPEFCGGSRFSAAAFSSWLATLAPTVPIHAVSMTEGINCADGMVQQGPDQKTDWKPPTPQSLGWTGLTDAEIKDHAKGGLVRWG